MIQVTGEQLQKASGRLRAEARRAPVEITYHGRAELVVLSVEDYAVLRQNRKLAFTREQMTESQMRRIASNRMDAEHTALDGLMDD